MAYNLTVMVGAPASGKSTWARYHADMFAVVSRDEIRFDMLNENDDYFAKEDLVYDAFIDNIVLGLGMGMDVIADATHLNAKSRKALLSQINTRLKCQFGMELEGMNVRAVYFQVPLETLIERNNKRTGRACVPTNVLTNMYNKLTKPAREEGFDSILTLNEDAIIIEEIF